MALIGESFAGMATALNRVAELYQPAERRLFEDRFAFDLLPPGWRIVTRILFLPGIRQGLAALRERRMPGSLGSILGRTCYIDDVLRRSLSEGIDQLVILGAGFDSRAYRMPGIDQVEVFEVDLPGLIQVKQDRVEKVLGAAPEHVTFVGIDFDQHSLGDVLEAVGYRSGARTLFIWEGVTQYITPEAVDDTLQFVSGASGKGSGIVFTYVRQGVINGTAGSEAERRIAAMVSRLGSPWTFGIDPAGLEQFLAERGLELVDEVGAAEYRERYLVPRDRDMDVIDTERTALARV